MLVFAISTVSYVSGEEERMKEKDTTTQCPKYHIPLQNTDKVETGQTGSVLNLQPLCISFMVCNVTLEKSYHLPLTA